MKRKFIIRHQQRCIVLEVSPSVVFLLEGCKTAFAPSTLASLRARGRRTAPRGWCRLREGVGPFNFANRRRATRRKTGGVIVGNMRETFNLSRSKQALATPPPSPLRRARFFHSGLLLLLLLFLLLFPPPSPSSFFLPLVFRLACSLRKCFAA